jgi:rhodanese-related sulfurtransferase
MLRRLINLPFRVLGHAARAVQAREDEQQRAREAAAASPAEDGHQNIPAFDTPDDFLPDDLGRAASWLRAALDRGEAVVVADLRPEAEFLRAALPGALGLPAATLGIRLSELPPAGVPVLVYDEDGGELARACARFLRFRGLDEVWLLEGGLRAWRQAGGPLAPGVTLD